MALNALPNTVKMTVPKISPNEMEKIQELLGKPQFKCGKHLANTWQTCGKHLANTCQQSKKLKESKKSPESKKEKRNRGKEWDFSKILKKR